MHKKHDTLGDVIKNARQNSEFTMEVLSNRVGVSERYLYRIENEGQKPSFDVLNKLVHELSIPPEKIFYPEKPSKESEVEKLARMLYSCDERGLKVVRATIKALIETDVD